MTNPVLKFGGDVLRDIEGIKRAVKEVKKFIKKNTVPVVVVSAMGDTTDELLRLSSMVSKNPDSRELDMLLTAGERISMALFAMALKDENIKARSLTGSQAGILTSSTHKNAKIIEIRGKRIIESIERGEVPIIAGFQGVSTDREITTLGRGGSDLTACALAVFLKSKEVIFYKDVDGIYSLDPKLFKRARRIEVLNYEEVLFLSEFGAEVLNPRAVAISMRFSLKLYIRSLLKEGYTMIKDKAIETPYVKGISFKKGLSMLFVKQVKKNLDVPQIVKFLTDKDIPVLFFFHGHRERDRMDLSFVCETKSFSPDVIREINKIYKPYKIEVLKNIGVLGLIGYGIVDSPEILKGTLKILEENNIHIYSFFTSRPGIVIVIKEKDLKKSLKVLSEKWGLLY